MFAKDRVIQRNPLNSGNHRTTNDVIKNVVFVLKFFILISFILQEDSNRQVEAEETISRALEGYYRRKGQRKEIRAYSRSTYVRGLRAHSSNSSKYVFRNVTHLHMYVTYYSMYTVTVLA